MSRDAPFPSLAALASLCIACGSDPLDQGAAESGGAPGSGGESGGPAEPPGVELPDYADSPCWGQSATTQIYNGTTHMPEPETAVCRGEGERVRVYVAEELWDEPVTQAHVNGLLHRLELVGGEGSYREDLGILPTNEEVFGALAASELRDGKLAIFVIDTQGGGDGYRCGWCEPPELHLDGTLLRPLSGETALAIVAHESYHAIHRGFDANERLWVDESLAEAAMTVNGFTDQEWLDAFLSNPNVDWGPASNDVASFQYGAGLLWGTYLWELGGPELMRALTQEPLDDWAGIDAALSSTGRGEGAFQHYLDMAVALYLDDADSAYSFEAFDFGTALAASTLRVTASLNVTLEPYGLAFFRLTDGAQGVRVDGTNAAVLSARWITTEPADSGDLAIGETMPLEASGSSAVVITATSATTATVTLE